MAVDFHSPDAVVSNVTTLARQGINIVLGTTGWGAHEAELKKIVSEAGVGIVAAPNFSTGVVLFEMLVVRAAEIFAAQPEFGARVPRGSSRGQVGRTVRHGTEAQEIDGGGRIQSPD